MDTGTAPIVLLVLGMHRSGTSALAGALARLGVPMGSRMVDAAPDNPAGYWEHADAVTAHERLLHAIGRGWDDPRPLPDDWLESQAAEAAMRELDVMIERDFASEPLWAIKDPRLCRLLPLWRRLLERRGLGLRCLLMFRAPAEIADSLSARDGMSREHARLLWAQHLLDAELGSRGIKRAALDYESLLTDPVAALESVGQAMDVRWPLEPRAARNELSSFLDKGLRHHQRVDADPDGEWCAVLYERARRVTAGKADLASLSESTLIVSARVASALPWLNGMGEALSRSRRRLDECQARLEQTDVALETARELSLERLDALASCDRQLEKVQSALESVKALSIERLETIHTQDRRLRQANDALESVKALALERLATTEALSSELQALSTELHQILESRSWRYTRPLRALSSKIRRLVGLARSVAE